MSWNYRVFKTQYASRVILDAFRNKEPHFEQNFTIREVYYSDDELSQNPIRMISAGDCGISSSGETLDELWEDLHHMLLAFEKPVLTPHDIPGYQYDKDEIPYDNPPTRTTLVEGENADGTPNESK